MAEQEDLPPLLRSEPGSVKRQVVDILLWKKDTVLSLVLFLCGWVMYILVHGKEYTLFSVLCYVAILDILVVAFYVRARKATGSAFDARSKNSAKARVRVSEESVREVVVYANAVLHILSELALSRDTRLVVKSILLLLIGAIVGRCLDGPTLLFLFHFFLFFFPSLYVRYPKWVDRQVHSVFHSAVVAVEDALPELAFNSDTSQRSTAAGSGKDPITTGSKPNEESKKSQ